MTLSGVADLAALEARIAHDLAVTAYPTKPWLRPMAGPDGAHVYDVVIVGAGQSGLAAAFGLRREKVENVLVIDAAPAGREGPWMTFARMPTLRSPKYLTGIDLGVPSLTFRAWYEAQHGAAAWEALGKIPTDMWMAYLMWFRRLLDLPVENDCRLERTEPVDGIFRLHLTRAGLPDTIYARKVVYCTGLDGTGEWYVPDIVRDNLPPDRFRHAADPAIDFAALRGKTVAVLGAGASAFDQASVALEQGAADVHVFSRRETLNRVQPFIHLELAGFLRNFAELTPEWRWRFMNYLLRQREPCPPETWERATRHENFHLHTGAPWDAVRMDGDRIRIETPKGVTEADFVICGTGITVDMSLRPELADIAPHVATWADRYTPPPEEANPWIASYPYLDPACALTEKAPGTAPWLRHLHVFTFGATLSIGFSGGGMNGLKYSLPRLIGGITKGLFEDDVEQQYQALLDYQEPLFDLGKWADKDAAE